MAEHHAMKRREDEEESESPPAPDGGWGWMVVFGSFMIHVITDGVTYSFGIFYYEFLEYFKEGKSLTSWILSILVGVTLCSGPISSSLVNRWGCRAVTIAGAILASACMVVSYWAKNVITLCVTIGIGTGLGFGLIYLPAIVSVTMYFEKKRSLATGIAVCGSGFGTFIFAPIISKLLTAYGWRGSLMIIAAIVLGCTVFGALFRPLEKPEKELSDKTLKACEAQLDVRVSDREFTEYGPVMHANGESKMLRPHSVAHFSLPKSTKHEPNGNIPEKLFALSQPMLSQYYGSLRRHHGPIDKPDVFYQGSLMNIPSYRSRLDLKHPDAFRERSHSAFSYRKHYRSGGDGPDAVVCGCVSCSPETKDTLKEMLDFSLFKDPIFIIFSVSNLLTSIGFNIPYVYLVPKGMELGMSVEKAGILISIIGIANTVGRIVLGYISDKPWIDRLQVYNWSLAVCGAATFISAFCGSFATLASYSVIFGFTIGAYVGLTSVILVDLLGLEKLTNAFGLLLLFQGIASLIGPPLAGGLFDLTQSYDPGFCLAGVTICLSGLVLFAIPPMQRWRANKARRTPMVVEEL
ncbi:monocarboxylate transporter 12 [Cylas formicarius]|uniref:monocarboxylate transporter 12 n=1 Tax=Cylas formicarius TaxID=197179 RepID=UPI0029586FBB|nr:monocarboxylate transporter 12 [Cylas formicarius]XP_060518856.1 monocarboxylate transporter 12 [Cylas formicarius]XP_060518858.1 monocarboxylate transporter 12 [Cylas formicarius]